jgi:hypothetical protein
MKFGNGVSTCDTGTVVMKLLALRACFTWKLSAGQFDVDPPESLEMQMLLGIAKERKDRMTMIERGESMR